MKHFPLLSFIRWTQEREDIFSATCLCINMHSSPVTECIWFGWVRCGCYRSVDLSERQEFYGGQSWIFIWILSSFEHMKRLWFLSVWWLLLRRCSLKGNPAGKDLPTNTFICKAVTNSVGKNFQERGFCHLVWSRQRFSDGWTKRKLHETEGSREKNQQHKQCNVRQKPAVSNEAVQRKLSLLSTAHPLKLVLLNVLP